MKETEYDPVWIAQRLARGWCIPVRPWSLVGNIAAYIADPAAESHRAVWAAAHLYARHALN